MPQNAPDIFFQIVAFLFAISVHESAHAWTANKCGDPTARMLGRISLNPIKHIDPIGTVILPLLALIYHFPMIGWAKPTPVDPRHFKHEVRDDILTSLAGPISNLIVASLCTLAIIILRRLPLSISVFEPLGQMLWWSVVINVVLAVFNVIPVPPLDGSHVLRHMLPEGARQMYDRIGMIGLVLLFVAGGRIISIMMYPVINFFYGLLARF